MLSAATFPLGCVGSEDVEGEAPPLSAVGLGTLAAEFATVANADGPVSGSVALEGLHKDWCILPGATGCLIGSAAGQTRYNAVKWTALNTPESRHGGMPEEHSMAFTTVVSDRVLIGGELVVAAAGGRRRLINPA